MAQRKEIAKKQTFNHTPRSMEDLEFIAKKFSESSLCPSSMKGRPNDVFAVMITGDELGLKPGQSVRVLASINGVAFAHGDGITFLCQRHPEFDGMVEWMEGKIEDRTAICYCTMKRKGKPDITNYYSMKEAEKAQLLGKDNWQKHPRRMLQRRARSYAAKDQFADALMGILSEDEAESIIMEQAPIVAKEKGSNGFREMLGIKQEVIVEAEFEEAKTLVEQLTQLIIEKGVPDERVAIWKKNANVKAIEELPETAIINLIQYLKTKETKNGISTANGRADPGIKSDNPGKVPLPGTEG